MRAFIVRPFNTRNGIDFQEVEKQLIAPALAQLDIQGGTTEMFSESGNIREDMFQQLLVADIVIADISVQNPNVYYELGIRHALRPRHTFLVRAKVDKLLAESAREHAVPFDIQTDRYLEYDPADPSAMLQRLKDGLNQTIASQRFTDSPVFMMLPGLEPPDKARFIAVPATFREEVELAAKDRGRLGLLAMEVRGLPWESEGLRLIARAQFELKADAEAKNTWEAVRKLSDRDVEANQKLGMINRRVALLEVSAPISPRDVTNQIGPEWSGDPRAIKGKVVQYPERFRLLEASNQALSRVVENKAASSSSRAEALFLLGCNIEDQWVSNWTGLNDLLAAQAAALESPDLIRAYEKFKHGFYQDLNSFAPGLNALGLLTLRLELARKLPRVWESLFPPEEEPEKQLDTLDWERVELIGAVKNSLEAARRALETAGEADWRVELGRAEFQFLANKKSRNLPFTYRAALSGISDTRLDDARRRLEVFGRLKVFEDNAVRALKVFPAAATPEIHLGRVILFTGLRIDPARFPASVKDKAKAALRESVLREKNRTEGDLIAIASAANGGDLLFHEVCEDLGIEHSPYLPLPPESFRAACVSPAGREWEDRFDMLLRKYPSPAFLADSASVPDWLSVKKGYTNLQRANLWLIHLALAVGAKSFTLLCLWDGETSNEIGGIYDMRTVAQERGAFLATVSTTDLLEGDSV